MGDSEDKEFHKSEKSPNPKIEFLTGHILLWGQKLLFNTLHNGFLKIKM